MPVSKCAATLRIFDNVAATHLYRIAQEAINNATRHGSAQNIEIPLSDRTASDSLRISDDGAGLSHTARRPGPAWG